MLKMFSLKLLIFAFIAFKKIFALECQQCTEKLSIYDGSNWSTTDINKALTGIGTIDTNTAG